MLKVQTRLRPNSQEVAAKVMDGEAILINLSNGIYYSMDKVGGRIWELVEKGYSLEEMVTTIAKRYEVATEQAQSDVERLVAELLQENLVLEADGASPQETTPFDGSEQREPYEAPQLNIYRDMGALLALDPPMPGLEATPWKDSDKEPPK
jgi:Coenzyme PQQ synthesis protein D (PqqD)